ncbi:uncharacterized protein N7482_007857 [Penicillium canariense]|uniref:Helicase C-terminal domain-containing protein n=1 Tax=Penicillium canariense TaxID=189055 RepID=A0A9W9HXP6_9EURO|nr:uncharacterized protein N7482_007857 [Penicillium canariense]KAJ5160853.1 hypothetical protein N7482_007857 [Penicillium canariense]
MMDESRGHDGGGVPSSAAAPTAAPGPLRTLPTPLPASLHPDGVHSVQFLESTSCTSATSPSETSSNCISSNSSINGQSQTRANQDDGDPNDLESHIPIGVLWRSADPQTVYPGPEIALLEAHRWIRTHVLNESSNVQVYVDHRMTNRGNTQRSITKLRTALKVVMAQIDASPGSWEGQHQPNGQNADTLNGAEDESLWYIFNTLKNPSPQVETMKDDWSRRAMEYLLSEEDFSDLGLKTQLFPYQRRSAAIMVQREAQPAQMLDPRLQACQTPMGCEYYYDKEDAYITLDKVLYSEACGGILAETMGCGKTLICLAVIWATRGHFPKIPIKYMSTPERPDLVPIRGTTGSLMDMAAAAAGRHSEPWRIFFSERQQEGRFYDRCMKACEANRGFYEIPPHQTRYRGRHSQSYARPPGKKIRLCSGTLVIVPNNLMDHWQREIKTHTDGLEVLVLRQGSDKTPSADELLHYDIVLYSKTRFEREAGEPVHNRRGRLVQVDSPLMQLHWLRVIVDEGHNVAGHGSKTNMIHLLSQLHFERRWVISGTPSTGLYGVEVSLASQEANTSDTESPEEITAAALRGRQKTGNAVDNELKDLDRLRRIVIEFLDLQPWSNSRAEDPADWTKYIKPIGKNGKRRKTPAMRATLQGLVVRHRLDIVSKEIYIPKLYNKVVYLEPTFHDRLSINLFLFGLAVNSITSERQGPDYIFDPSNRKHLNQTINNLRQAGFWWAGSDLNPQDSIDHSLKYMDKNREKMTIEDIDRLTRGMDIARVAMASSSWRQFKHLHELGIFIKGFPHDHRAHWALDQNSPEKEPMLIGITQARRAQQHVTQHLKSFNPTQGLAGAGIKARTELERRDQRSPPKGALESSSSTSAAPGRLNHSPKPQTNKSPKKTFTRNLFHTLPATSPLQQTQFLATASAKLSYLLDKVLELQATEKIIIFYDNNNSAFWIAEGLEILGIEFRIYASTLKPELRTEYLKLFREAEDVRVLLMDLRQASHGLHIAQASRVFIVNPIWQPNVESQAIKRAHRIGQTRPVFVETLVLRDTLEDRMLRRRKEMSEAEMQHAEKSLLDDGTMSAIIQNEPFLEMGPEESTAAAYLARPTGFFDRHRLPVPDDENDGVSRSAKGKGKGKGKRVPGVGESDADEGALMLESPTPLDKKLRVGFASNVEVLMHNDDAVQSQSKTKRALFVEPDASSGAAGSPVPKKQRIGFASSVEILGDERTSESKESNIKTSSPLPPSDGGEGLGQRRDSLFGP